MSEWLNEAFSGSVSIQRANPWGLALIILAVIVESAAAIISKHCSESRQERVRLGIKLAGLILCGAGAVITTL